MARSRSTCRSRPKRGSGRERACESGHGYGNRGIHGWSPRRRVDGLQDSEVIILHGSDNRSSANDYVG